MATEVIVINAQSGTKGESAVQPVAITAGTNELANDAWGRPKSISDISLFHGLWTYDVPASIWLEYLDGVEQSTIGVASSLEGMLNVPTTAGDGSLVRITSRRHPRYQPNKGHLYSTAVNVPTPTADGIAEWGLFNNDNAVCFRAEGDGADYTLSVVIRRLGVEVDVVDITANLPEGFDITKGHVYDIQMQWRGVGNIKVFIDLALVHTFAYLGTLAGLSTANPALPVAFEVKRKTEPYSINVGCVDVTSEGGTAESLSYSSQTTGATLLTVTNTETAVMGYKIPTSHNGKVFTRDTILKSLTSFCKDESVQSVYIGRSAFLPNLTGLTWQENSSTLNEYIEEGGKGSALDVAFQLDKGTMQNIYSVRQEIDIANEKVTPAGVNFFLTAGDILVVSMKPDGTNKLGGCTIELAVEI